MWAVRAPPYFCVTRFSFTVSWMCACIYCLPWARRLSRVCLYMSLSVLVWERQSLSPRSNVLCSQRGAWLPSLYEPSVQSDRNKKPYSALGIGKAGFGEKHTNTQLHGHAHTHAHTHTDTHSWKDIQIPLGPVKLENGSRERTPTPREGERADEGWHWGLYTG